MKRVRRYTKVGTKLLVFVAGVTSLLLAILQWIFTEDEWAPSAWYVAISTSLIAYFAYVLQRDWKYEKGLRKVRSMSEKGLSEVRKEVKALLAGLVDVVEGRKDYSEVVLRKSSYVDIEFWSRLSNRLEEPEIKIIKPWITRNAASTGDVAVPKKYAYGMMRVMLTLLEEGSVYSATVDVVELSDADAMPIFDLAFLKRLKERAVEVRRALLLPHDELRKLDAQSSENLRTQIEGGVKLFCLAHPRVGGHNFGLYGNKCLGEMVQGWNTFRFSPENVDRGKELWRDVEDIIRPLELEDLDRR